MRFGIIGSGFWARYQLAAWGEIEGAECVALCDRDQSKAEDLAETHGISSIYADAEEMLLSGDIEFVDVISDAATHENLVELAARCGTPVICQKPLAPTLASARSMARVCEDAGVPLLVHENWRWQAPIRAVKHALASGVIGEVFRARIDYCNRFPVFDNQPHLRELDRFILTDMGPHILDVSRFLFGEASSLWCQTEQVSEGIRGEDVASVMMRSERSGIVTCHLSYASRIEQDRFPEAFIFIEGSEGSIELAPDYWVRVTGTEGTSARRHPPTYYPWADPRYALVQSSMVPCLANLFAALQNGGAGAETTAQDNLKTLKLVEAAYTSAAQNRIFNISNEQNDPNEQ